MAGQDLEQILKLFRWAFRKRRVITFEYLLIWTPEQSRIVKFVNIDNQAEYE